MEFSSLDVINSMVFIILSSTLPSAAEKILSLNEKHDPHQQHYGQICYCLIQKIPSGAHVSG
jgi:hypothetical protein